MRADFVARAVHVPTRFNSGAETRARMFREQRWWLTIRRIAAILAGDLNAKRPLSVGKQVQHLAAHSVDAIYGTEEWEVLEREVILLRARGLSDHDAVRVVVRHKPTGQVITVATVNMKRHWKWPAYRAEKIWARLDADVVICNEANEAQVKALRGIRGVRAHRAPSNSFRGGWAGNCIAWRADRVFATKRRSRPVAFIYFKGKKRRRRPRIPIPAVNWSPMVWFAFAPGQRK